MKIVVLGADVYVGPKDLSPPVIEACMAGYRVLFLTVQKLMEKLTIAKREGNLVGEILAYGRLHLLIIDEMGYMLINKPKES